MCLHFPYFERGENYLLEKNTSTLAKKYNNNPKQFIFLLLKRNKEVPYNQKGKIFLDIGYKLWKSSYFNLAIACCEKALQFAMDCKDTLLEVNCYFNLGITYGRIQSHHKAVENIKLALDIFGKLDNQKGIGECYKQIGIAHLYLSDFQKAHTYLLQALSIFNILDNKKDIAECHINLGIVNENLGNYQKALEDQKKALKIVKTIGNQEGEANCYINLGNIYYSLGDAYKVINFQKQALEIYQDIGNKNGEANCYINLGNAFHDVHNFKESIIFQEKALEIKKDLIDKNGIAECYNNLGMVYISLTNYLKAIEYNKLSLEIFKKIGDQAGEAKCLGLIAISHVYLKNYQEAEDYLHNALKIFIKTKLANGEVETRLNLAQLYYKELNNFEKAYDQGKIALELFEKLRKRLTIEEHKINLFSTIPGSYELMVNICINQKKEKEALEYVERSKSRALLDLLAYTKLKSSATNSTALKTLLDKEEECINILREVQTKNLGKGRNNFKPVEIDKVNSDLQYIYDQIEKIDPEYTFIRRGKTLDFKRIRKLVSSQKKATLLIEYFITQNNLYIFIVSPVNNNKLKVKTIPVSSKTIYNYIFDAYWNEVVHYPDFKNSKNNWQILSKYLIDPIAEYLKGAEIIYFIPQGALHYLPLHALKLKNNYLIETYPIVYAPSASIINFCKKKGTGNLKNCICYGIDFQEEALDVSKIFNADIYLNGQATKKQIKETCCNKDIIHFSCHGSFNNKEPLLSGIKLYDGILTAKEIFNFNLNSELVTLSACETGLNKRRPGDELIGLTRAFLYAGSPSLVVSLWKVHASSTQELMKLFYTLLKEGKDKATALQQAQIKISKEYPHPYYWAPFILVGDWE